MLDENSFSFTFTCDYCGKVFLKFNLSALYYCGYGKMLEDYIKSARNAGHIIDDNISDGYRGDTLDFCRRKCENKYHKKNFPDIPPDIIHMSRFIRDIEELGDDTNELDDLVGMIDFHIDEDVYNF